MVCSTATLLPASIAVRVVGGGKGGVPGRGGAAALALVGTANNFLLLFDFAQRRLLRVLTQAHGGETWALCHYPLENLRLCATGATDGTIRFWDLDRRTAIIGRLLNFGQGQGVSTLDFSPQGDLLASGHFDGSLHVVSFPDLQAVQVKAPRGRIATEKIADVKFDPAGEVLAAGGMDQLVHIFAVTRPGVDPGGEPTHLTFLRSLQGNTASVSQIMFLNGSEMLMTNSTDGQILFFNPRTGDRLSATSTQNASWDGFWTCVCGWPTVGMWAANKVLSLLDIPSVCSMEVPCSTPQRRTAGCLLASGEAQGSIKLYRFPALNEKQAARRYYGHGTCVTAVRFAPVFVLPDFKEGSGLRRSANTMQPFVGLLASIGGDDKALLQWKLTVVPEAQSPQPRRNEPWIEKQVRPVSRFEFPENPQGVGGLANRASRTQLWGHDPLEQALPPPSWPPGSDFNSTMSGAGVLPRPSVSPSNTSGSRRRPQSASATVRRCREPGA